MPRTNYAARAAFTAHKAEIDTALDRIRTAGEDRCSLIEPVQACWLRLAKIALATVHMTR